ncbi:MAG TPA: hypothetical protein VFM21_04205 [Terriglobia bacterium]|nr:hypothetical protein [Terriglobia bacterium]
MTDIVLGTVVELTPDTSGASNVGNLFRSDPTAGQYIFNLSTKGFTQGTHQLRVNLNDGTHFDVYVSLR